jgi:hypothetical protein
MDFGSMPRWLCNPSVIPTKTTKPRWLCNPAEISTKTIAFQAPNFIQKSNSFSNFITRIEFWREGVLVDKFLY